MLAALTMDDTPSDSVSGGDGTIRFFRSDIAARGARRKWYLLRASYVHTHARRLVTGRVG